MKLSPGRACTCKPAAAFPASRRSSCIHCCADVRAALRSATAVMFASSELRSRVRRREVPSTRMHHAERFAVALYAGNFLGPTVLTGVTAAHACYQQELFGPVLVVLEASDLRSAIDIVNSHRFANGCAVFTSSGAAARAFEASVDVGMVGINVRGFASPDRPCRTTEPDAIQARLVGQRE